MVANIRSMKVVLILIGVLKVNFTAWSNLTAVKNHLVRMPIVVLVVINIDFARIRILKVVLTLLSGAKAVFTAWSNLTAVENCLVG